MCRAFSDTMIVWIALIALGAACHGLPVADEPAGAGTVGGDAAGETAEMTVATETRGYPMDDETPPTRTSSPSAVPVLVFVDVPEHTETELGTSVLLTCRTANPVAECQWSWQPLPPVHLPLPDVSESPPPISTTTAITTVTTTPTTHSLPVRQFPAFGNNSNDCSVRFSSAKHEQTGYWTCAARTSTSEPFVSTKPAKLSIINANHGILITFVEHENVIEVPAGSSAQIMCQTKLPVRECQWSWRQLNQSQPWNLDVKSFPAFGNESTECSIKFKNVLLEQEGYWTCGARINPNSSFTQSTPVRFLISEVEFVQLSRGVQVAAGESVLLRCLANKPVVQCEWSWRASNSSSKEPLLVKKFSPNKDADHDCSVRFKNILYEEEGLWTCGVRLTPDGILHTAPATTVSLLPTAKVHLVETPADTAVLVGTETTLKCVTSSRVEKCVWTRRPLHGSDPEMVVVEFPSNGDLGRDCSLHLPHVYAEKQGQWSCRASIASLNTILTSAPAMLTVFEQDEVKFSELSQDIQISSGGSVLLRCVTSSAVEQCRWSLTPVNSNTTVVVKQFPAAGNEARDCSVRLSHALAEQEGLWTCGARIRGRQNYTDAPPAKLSLLEPEPVTIAVWATPHQMVTLACRVGPISSQTKCHWIHAPKIHIHQNSSKLVKKMRHNIQMDYTMGICKLAFKPDHSDLGEWTCKFTLANENADIEIGSATLILMNSLTDEKLGWIVGALTAVILFLMIIVVVLVVCKARIFIRKTPEILETLPSGERKQSARFCDGRHTGDSASGKINFQFVEDHGCTSSIDGALPNRSLRAYDRTEKIHGMSSKTYDNVGL